MQINNIQQVSYNMLLPSGVSIKTSSLLLLLLLRFCPVHAQFVDILIDLPATIELKTIGYQISAGTTDSTEIKTQASRQNNLPRLIWTRIRSDENMQLMVEIRYHDMAAEKRGPFAAYLNNGSYNTNEALTFEGNRAVFPINCNTWQIDRIHSPPRLPDAWIGIPAGTVRSVMIGYN
jgi:hypothetical protein